LKIKTRYITSGWAGSSCRGSEVYYETATEKLIINFAALLERSGCWQKDQNHILTVVDIYTVEVGRPLLYLELARLLASARFVGAVFLCFSLCLSWSSTTLGAKNCSSCHGKSSGSVNLVSLAGVKASVRCKRMCWIPTTKNGST
jgi:hypothetical protein